MSGPRRIERCPECAADADRRGPPSARPSRLHVAAAMILFMLLAIVGLSLVYGVGASRAITSSGGYLAQSVYPGFTLGDVRRIAGDDAADSDDAHGLAEAVYRTGDANFRLGAGRVRIEAAFGPGAKQLVTVRIRGWPAPWLTLSDRAWYENAPLHRGFIPVETNDSLPVYTEGGLVFTDHSAVPPRSFLSWSGGKLWVSPSPEQTNGVLRTWIISPAALGVPLAAALLAAGIASLLCSAVSYLRARRLRAGTVYVWGVAAVVFVAMLIPLLLVCESRTMTYVRWPSLGVLRDPVTGVQYSDTVYEQFRPLPFTRQDLGRMLEDADADADRRVARAILDTIADTSGISDDHVLTLVPIEEARLNNSQRTTFAFGALSILDATYAQHPDFADSGPFELQRRREAWLGFSRVNVRVRSRADPATATVVTVSLPDAAIAVLVLLGAWPVTVGLTRLHLWRQGRKRWRLGHCTACGYDLGLADERATQR